MAAGSIVIDLLMKTGSFITDIGRAEKSTKSFQKATVDLGGALRSVAPFLTVGAVVAYSKSVIDAADAMKDLSIRTGVSVKTLASLELAAEQNGTSIEGLGNSLRKLNLSFSQASSSDEIAQALKNLGVTSTDAGERLLQLADAYEKASNKNAILADLQKVLGKSYAEIIPLLSQGRAELERSIKSQEDYANGQQKLANQADALNDSLAELNKRYSSLSINILTRVLPAFTDYVEEIDKIIAKNGLFVGSLAAIGGAIFYAFEGSKLEQAETRIKTLNEQMQELLNISNKIRNSPENKGKSIDELGFLSSLQIKNLQSDYNKLAKELRGVQKEYDALKQKAGGNQAQTTTPDALPSFADLTKELKLQSQLKAEFESQSKAITEAAKREGTSATELADALQKLREKIFGKAQKNKTEKADNPWADYTRDLAAYLSKLDNLINKNDTVEDGLRSEFNALQVKDEAMRKYIESQIQLVKIQEQNVKIQDEVQKKVKAINETLAQTPTGQLEALRKEMAALYEALDAGLITLAQFQEMVDVKLGRTVDINKDATDAITEFWKQAAQNMQDAMSNFFFDAMQGKLGDLATSFKATIDRMVANLLASQLMDKLFGKEFSSSGGATIGGWIGKAFDWLKSANGNAFNSTGVMAFANGGVVTSPTMFQYGGGNLGVMGEAGAEAILPLQRGADGKLGVKMHGNASGVSVTNNFTINGTMDSRTQQQIAAQVYASTVRASRRNN